MKALNLETLKIEEYTNDYKIITLPFQKVNFIEESIVKISNKIDTFIKDIFSTIDNEKYKSYGFEIRLENNKIGLDNFQSFINLFLLQFVNNLLLNSKREREYRLDIPEDLKQTVNISRSLLKKIINEKTKLNCFNIHISCGNLHFELVEGI